MSLRFPLFAEELDVLVLAEDDEDVVFLLLLSRGHRLNVPGRMTVSIP